MVSKASASLARWKQLTDSRTPGSHRVQYVALHETTGSYLIGRKAHANANMLCYVQMSMCNVPQPLIRAVQASKDILQLLKSGRVGIHVGVHAMKLMYFQLTREGSQSRSLLEASWQGQRGESLRLTVLWEGAWSLVVVSHSGLLCMLSNLWQPRELAGHVGMYTKESLVC